MIFKYLIQTIISIIIVLLGLIFLKHTEKPTIAKVDLIAITNHYATLATNADKDKLKEIATSIKNNLMPILNDYAKEHRVIIIQSQAIVTGDTPDITNYVINKLDENRQ